MTLEVGSVVDANAVGPPSGLEECENLQGRKKINKNTFFFWPNIFFNTHKKTDFSLFPVSGLSSSDIFKPDNTLIGQIVSSILLQGFFCKYQLFKNFISKSNKRVL